MKFVINTAILVLTALAFAIPAQTENIGTIKSEKQKLLQRIHCARQSNIPAGDGLGSLWGCYNLTEDVKLWINGQAENPSGVSNIKLAVVNYHGSKMDITGKIWAGIISEEYGGVQAEPIKTAFQKCPVKQNIKVNGLEILVKCSKGPKADEHLLIVYP